MSLFNDASLITTPNGVKAGKLFSVKPFDGSGDFTWVRNTSATRVNESGLIETIGANVPRLDYSNGGCPCILVEPQRTNLLVRSEEFENASWVKEISGGAVAPVISINSDISPRGDLTADQIDLSIIGVGFVWVRQFYSETSGTTYTFSIWLKGDGVNKIGLGGSNLLKTTITPTIEWVKYSITWIGTSTSTKRVGLFFSNAIASTTSIFAWGAQLEAGSNATSYIPTVASAVTRNADVGTLNTTGLGLTEITETFETGAPNVITTIPSTYQLPNGRIKTIVGL